MQNVIQPQRPDFIELVKELEQNFNVTFKPENETDGKIFALEASKQKNLELIDREFSDVVVLIQAKLPYIRSLAELNANIDCEINQLRRQGKASATGASA